MTTMQVIALNVAIPLLVAVVTAVVTVRLSLRRFRSERWWEMKARAYTRVIRDLHRLSWLGTGESMLRPIKWGATPGVLRELNEASITAFLGLAEATHTGAFLLSEDAVKALWELVSALPKKGSLAEKGLNSDQLALITDCIARVRASALSDLGV